MEEKKKKARGRGNGGALEVPPRQAPGLESCDLYTVSQKKQDWSKFLFKSAGLDIDDVRNSSTGGLSTK